MFVFIRSTECETDHRLIPWKFRLYIQKKIRVDGLKVPKRLDVSKLTQLEVRTSSADRIKNVFFYATGEVYKT